MTPLGAHALDVWCELASGAATAVTAIACLRTGRRLVGSQRSGWMLLCAAMVLWTLNTLATDLPVLLSISVPVGYAQALQGLAIAMILAGLLTLPTAPWDPGAFARMMLDVASTVLCVVLVGALTLARHVATMDGSAADHAFAELYPLAALLLGARAYVLGRGAGGQRRPDLALLCAGSVAWLIAGVGSALTGTGARVGSVWVSVAFAAGALFVAVAARCVPRVDQAPGIASSRFNRALIIVPEAATVAAVMALAFAGLRNWIEWLIGGLAFATVAIRQLVNASDGRRTRSSLTAEVAQRISEVRQMSDRQARILAAVGEGIIGINADGFITFVNVAAARMLGHDAEALVGRDACDVLCANPHEDCPLRLASSLGHVVTEDHVSFRRADGSLLPIEVTIAPKKSVDGEGRLGLVLAFRDVTERQAVEEMKQQFISSVSHELRTPLTSIRGVLEMLADGDAGELPTMAHQLIATAERGSERLSRLVNDIIDVEKLASGQFDVVPRPTYLEPLIRDAIASLEGLAASTGVRLRVGQLDGRALCDPDRTEQALVNLIGNAVKFSPEDGDVVVTAIPEEHQVRVSVRDYGRGIPPDEIQSVFERFHQVAHTDASEKGGTGLGLTITRSIIERHGGQIWVESVFGAGTTFHFTLPLAPPPGTQPTDDSDADGETRTPPPTYHRAVAVPSPITNRS